MPREIVFVQHQEHRLTLVVLAEIRLHRCQRGQARGFARTASSAIRACISYTFTVNSFFMRCTCEELGSIPLVYIPRTVKSCRRLLN